MTSQAQIDANRKNAQKSTGPKTDEGKAAVSQNAVKHGLFIRTAVVGDESREEYDLHREELLAEWSPVGRTELIVAERLIDLSWRLERARRMQNQAIEYLGLEQLDECHTESFEETYREANDLSYSDDTGVAKDHILLGRLAIRDWANYRSLDRMMMYEQRIESGMYRAIKELERLQKARKERQAVAARESATEEKTIVESPPPRRERVDFAKQTQFAAARINATSSVEKDYGDISPAEAAENKANQSQIQTHGCPCVIT